MSVAPGDTQKPPAVYLRSRMVWRRAYPGRADQARLVRRFVDFLVGDSPLADEAVLAAGELAANAIRHTRSGRPGGTFVVEVRRWGDDVVVAVSDQGAAGEPALGDPDDLAESGRGLRAIQTTAHHLGWTGDDRGRTVFAIFAPC